MYRKSMIRFRPSLQALEGRRCLAATAMVPEAVVDSPGREAMEVNNEHAEDASPSEEANKAEEVDGREIFFEQIGAASAEGQDGSHLVIVNNGDGSDSRPANAHDIVFAQWSEPATETGHRD